LQVFGDLVVSLNPLTLLVWGAGIISMFHDQMRRYSPLIISILLSTALLAFSKGKGYYFGIFFSK